MKTSSIIVYSIIIFSIGITVGKLFDWGYFDLDKNISIIQAITLFVTVGVGLYITKTLEREVQNNRVEKDLYLLKITEIEAHLVDIEKLVECGNAPFLKITNLLHQISAKRKLVFEDKKSVIKKCNKEQLSNKEISLKSRMLNLKKMLTDTPKTGVSELDISVKDNVVLYSNRRIIDINTELDSLRNELFRLKIIINLS